MDGFQVLGFSKGYGRIYGATGGAIDLCGIKRPILVLPQPWHQNECSDSREHITTIANNLLAAWPKQPHVE